MPPTSSRAARTIRVAVSTAARGTSGNGKNSTGAAVASGACALPETPAPSQPVEFFPYFDAPPEAIDTARRIVRAAGIDVGGIEYLETTDGRRVFYDINANSNLRPSVAAAWGFDPFERVVDFLQRELVRVADNAARTAS